MHAEDLWSLECVCYFLCYFGPWKLPSCRQGQKVGLDQCFSGWNADVEKREETAKKGRFQIPKSFASANSATRPTIRE